jgi:hypothetical protein
MTLPMVMTSTEAATSQRCYEQFAQDGDSVHSCGTPWALGLAPALVRCNTPVPYVPSLPFSLIFYSSCVKGPGRGLDRLALALVFTSHPG